ncbi:type II toxin-antitoxin system prevent-host-death family antitoxin [Candidatus Wolfebacteria bacterium]|nr:type II toxin-antitoxin system prevent-host-death family antitoxin [Candidatus Wolfebacteria bacterium]
MKNIVGLKELRQNVSDYIAEVKKGKSFIVVRRSMPVFRISPPEEDELWEPIADFTKIKKGGVPLKDLLARL